MSLGIIAMLLLTVSWPVIAITSLAIAGSLAYISVLATCAFSLLRLRLAFTSAKMSLSADTFFCSLNASMSS